MQPLLSEKERSELLLEIMDAGLDFMLQSFLNDPDWGVMAAQLVKGLMATGAMSGMFKDPELGNIYRDKNLQTLPKGIRLAKVMARKMMEQSGFHKENAASIDVSLAKLDKKFSEIFDVMPMVPDMEFMELEVKGNPEPST